tara:strand:+ start:3800 stop:4039 length:240 start_codon:yes stop_codon:yes gene_type:complete
MYERMKALLRRCVDLMVAMVLVAAMLAYLMINSVIATQVINDLRLDTYVTYETGFGVVLLVLLLGWGPVWLMRSLDNHR